VAASKHLLVALVVVAYPSALPSAGTNPKAASCGTDVEGLACPDGHHKCLCPPGGHLGTQT